MTRAWLFLLLLAPSLAACAVADTDDVDRPVAPVASVQDLPGVMEATARRRLGDVLPPGSPAVTAYAAGRVPLGPEGWDRATSVAITFGQPGSRSWRLLVDSDAGDGPPRCARKDRLPVLRCDRAYGPDGSVLVARYLVDVATASGYVPASAASLASAERQAVQVRIDVEQFHHGSGRTTVVETVTGPAWPLDDLYFTSVSDLIKLVQSPRLARIPGHYPEVSTGDLWSPLTDLRDGSSRSVSPTCEPTPRTVPSPPDDPAGLLSGGVRC